MEDVTCGALARDPCIDAHAADVRHTSLAGARRMRRRRALPVYCNSISARRQVFVDDIPAGVYRSIHRRVCFAYLTD